MIGDPPAVSLCVRHQRIGTYSTRPMCSNVEAERSDLRPDLYTVFEESSPPSFRSCLTRTGVEPSQRK